MAVTPRENQIRTYRFNHPEWIPSSVHISAGCWKCYGVKPLEELLDQHKLIFPYFKKGRIDPDNPHLAPWTKANQPYTEQGCRGSLSAVSAQAGVQQRFIQNAAGNRSEADNAITRRHFG